MTNTIHKYKFTKTGKPDGRFFNTRRLKEKRTFPKVCDDVRNYVIEYYKLNVRNIIFVGVDYGKRESY